jgi:predicted nucleic acid-binding Zn ribbon protein
MTIRFSCQCGAQFEVSDDKAGLLGRCRNCGEEITIPDTPQPVDDDTTDSDESLPEQAASGPMVSADDEPLTETSPIQYCPFCGHQIEEYSAFCPNCRKILRHPTSNSQQHDPFTPIDWTLATVLAPVGLVLGFVSLATGNRKGLNMIGISTASMFVFWLISVVMGWIR